VFNIPASVDRVSTDASRSGALPHGAIQSRTDFGVTGYGGGCPPAGGGVHRYQFTVYALSVADLTTGDFPLDANAPSAMVSFVVHASALDHATVEVPYQR
jgi:Raf kinase inhibitor-like YbhB/YbcL family protein